MSPALQIANARRKTARVALVTIVAIMTTMVLFSGDPFGTSVFAQQTTGGVSIKFVNPDSDTSNEITAIQDGVDTKYHIVAWVNANPPNPIVEFQFAAGTSTVFQTIGNGTLVGNDTWEMFWDSTSQTFPSDGNGTLKVNLYSGTGSGPVASDTETVRINQTRDPNSQTDRDVPNSVEITDPVNGGQMGFYSNANEYQGQVRVSATDTATRIIVYYSITSPGSDPVWEECGSEDRADAEDDGVTCTLQGDHRPDQVRAIAAHAQDDDEFNPPTFVENDSGDAHRVSAYVQDPTTITVDPQQQTQGITHPSGNAPDTYPCSGPIEVKVFDQNAKPIKGANVDVHAQGPSDSTQFDDPDGDSSAHKAPDQGTHGTEFEANCETTNAVTGAPLNSTTNQGDHELGGANDIKHIESAAAGTDENGSFIFKLLGRTTGTTQWTAWVDEDNNDLFCEQEPHVDGSIGWGVGAPTPTGVTADQATCPTASPPTPTRTATTTSPPPTNTTSPPPTNTTTPPPPPDDPEKRVFSTSVSIDYDRRPSDFEGNVRSNNKQCRQERDVLLKKQRKNRRDKVVGRDETNNHGQYRIVERRARGRYYVVAKRVVHEQNNGDKVVCQRGQSKTKRVRRR